MRHLTENESASPWICCQLGAREHYAIPRMLHGHGKLAGLLTDAWVPPGSLMSRLRRNLRERYHPAVPNEIVHSCTARAVGFEISSRLRRTQKWDLILHRNAWFQRRVAAWLSEGWNQLERQPGTPTLFSFSYTALQPFRWAKARGWRTVLGQIDGGLGDEKRIGSLDTGHRQAPAGWQPAPDSYWQAWRQECELADRIVVNSEWSRQLLLSERIPPEKVMVVPLAYQPTPESVSYSKAYPRAFDSHRPLRVLFLRQVTIRKGVLEILEAAQRLAHRPVEFSMVGPVVSPLPPALRNQPNVRWIGPIPRGQADAFYREADVFLFPTYSDGFGLTQLEAQAWKLPVIASRFCGSVVDDGINGAILPGVTGPAIADILSSVLRDPGLLQEWSMASGVKSDYGLNAVGAAFLEV